MSAEHLEFPALKRDDSVDWLIHVIDTIVKPIVRRKLHASLRDGDTRQRNQDALELIGDIHVKLLVELQNSSQSTGGVRDMAAYAVTVSANACYQYLRTQFPQRTRLRNKLRYLLTHEGRFALWRNKSDRWLCGLAEWEGQEVSLRIIETSHLALSYAGEREKTIALLNALFAESSGPLRFDDVVNYVCDFNGISEPSELALDIEEASDLVAEVSISADDSLELRARLTSLWNAVLDLPTRHRKALLLNLRDTVGDNLLAALPLAGVASIREIAAAMDLTFEQLVDMWNSLPWEDSKIAEHMGMKRQQVINLRQTARSKLTRWRNETGNI